MTDSLAISYFSAMKIGAHIVQRRPLPGTPYTRYMIMDGKDVIACQISYPSALDCEWHKRSHRTAKAKPAEETWANTPEVGALSVRALKALRGEKMGLGKLAKSLKCNPDVLSTVLTRLIGKGDIQRRGARGKFVYEASSK